MRWYGSIGHRRPSSGVSSSVRDASFATPATPVPPPPLAAATRAAFYLFGVVANIPWNALILSLPYLLDRLDGSPLQPYLGSSMVVTFNVAGLGALMVATWLADKLRPNLSIISSVCTIALTLSVLATIPLWPTSTLFWTVLAGTLALASAKSFFKTPVVSVATTFGPDALASYLSGTALVAVIISAMVFLVAYISNWSTLSDGKLGVTLSCSVCAMVSLASLAAFRFAVENTDTYKTKFKDRPKHTDLERDWLLRMHLQMVLVQGDGVWATTKRNWKYNVAQCWLYIATVAVFPAVTTRVESVDFRWAPLVFRAFHFLIFNCGDLFGRLFVSIYPISAPPYMLLAYSGLQTILASLFLFCNIHTQLPTRLADIPFLTLVFIFAFTSGYASSLGFVAVGRKRGARARSATRVLQLWMMVGYVLGGTVSFAVGKWFV